MATEYSDVYELFLGAIQDYKIDKLFAIDQDDAEAYMKTFMIRAIPYFDNCKKNLEDRNDATGKFNMTLATDELVILSNLMAVEWLRKETNDLRQMQLHLNDKDFRTYAEANNLKEKRETMNTIREDVERLMTKYSQKNIDWNNFM